MSKLLDDLSITINESQIETVPSEKLLGVLIDPKVSWSSHIDYICNVFATAGYPPTHSTQPDICCPLSLLQLPSAVTNVLLLRSVGQFIERKP